MVTWLQRVKVLLPFYPFTFLPLKSLFNVRNQDILINLTIVFMGSEPERYRHQLARSILTLRHIAQHCRSVLVLIFAAHLLENDVTFHHLSVLTFLTLTAKVSPCCTTLIILLFIIKQLQDLAFLSRLISSNSDLAESWCKDSKSFHAPEYLVKECPLIFSPLFFSSLFPECFLIAFSLSFQPISTQLQGCFSSR